MQSEEYKQEQQGKLIMQMVNLTGCEPEAASNYLTFNNNILCDACVHYRADMQGKGIASE